VVSTRTFLAQVATTGMVGFFLTRRPLATGNEAFPWVTFR
jgi:hypothetical protein